MEKDRDNVGENGRGRRSGKEVKEKEIERERKKERMREQVGRKRCNCILCSFYDLPFSPCRFPSSCIHDIRKLTRDYW